MKLNIKHIGYLALVILIVSLGLVGASINYFTSDQDANRIINIAGKQRMLSQRLFKDIYKLNQALFDKVSIVDNLQLNIQSMITAHNGLLSGDSELGLPPSNSAAVKKQHEKITLMIAPLETHLNALFASNGQLDLSTLLADAESLEDSLLAEFNRLVQIFEAEAIQSSSKIRTLYIAAGIFYLVILSLCIVSGLLLTHRMKKGVVQMQSQSSNLQIASETLSESSQELSSSSIEQEAAVSQTLSALVEIDAIIAKNTESARICLDNIENVKKISIEGNDTIDNLVNSLQTVNSSVDDLEQFNGILSNIELKTQVINDIVLKTQLLSVNASIEAERAGEYGVGFSVVAEEVGKLAITSGNEAKEITRLLNDSFGKVKELVENSRRTTNQGLITCDQSKELYQSINVEFANVSNQMQELTDASMQQDAGIKEVNSSMGSMKESIAMNSQSAAKYKDMASEFTKDANSLWSLANVFSQRMGIRITEGNKTAEDINTTTIVTDNNVPSVQQLVKNANALQDAKNDNRNVSADDESFRRIGGA